jgi:hypothetical protein
LRGIWTGSFRAAMVMATTPAVTPSMTSSRMISMTGLSTPVMVASQVRTMAVGKPSMMEKKISSDMPLPIPCSVICSPSHMMNIPPTVRIMVVVSMKKMPGFRTAPWMLLRNTE